MAAILFICLVNNKNNVSVGVGVSVVAKNVKVFG